MQISARNVLSGKIIAIVRGPVTTEVTLEIAEGVVDEHELEGVIQLASFHPQFQFEGTEPDDIGNYTNRAPFAILHLLREDSVERAVQAYPDAEQIFERNIATLNQLGLAGWQALLTKG